MPGEVTSVFIYPASPWSPSLISHSLPAHPLVEPSSCPAGSSHLHPIALLAYRPGQEETLCLGRGGAPETLAPVRYPESVSVAPVSLMLPTGPSLPWASSRRDWRGQGRRLSPLNSKQPHTQPGRVLGGQSKVGTGEEAEGRGCAAGPIWYS